MTYWSVPLPAPPPLSRRLTDPVTIWRLAWAFYRELPLRVRLLAAVPLVGAFVATVPLWVRLDQAAVEFGAIAEEWIQRVERLRGEPGTSLEDFEAVSGLFDAIVGQLSGLLLPIAVLGVIQWTGLMLTIGVSAAVLPARPGPILHADAVLARLAGRWFSLFALSASVGLLVRVPTLLALGGLFVMRSPFDLGRIVAFGILGLVGTIAVFILAIVALGRWSLAPALVVQRPIGPRAAAAVSRALTRGVTTDVAVSVGFAILGVVVLASIPGVVLTAVGGDPMRPAPGSTLISALLATAAQAIVVPYLGIVLALLSYRLSEVRRVKARGD
ncbi:MAG TPA: hypothetical protein VGQ47_01160 [Candidatus Limnocylindrales bacterium]|nr:hypothetical protein [Candidatus Limnocylindrales bacterium]